MMHARATGAVATLIAPSHAIRKNVWSDEEIVMKQGSPLSIRMLRADEIADLNTQVGERSAQLLTEMPWLDSLDVRHQSSGVAPRDLKVVAFNAERGSRFDGILALLRDDPRLRQADVILLSEVDWGMARSDNRHVARELADALGGLDYVFGIEFLELTKGEALELEAAGENTWSFHGNAILSRHPLRTPRLLRLPRCCSWAEGSQARIGGRMALLAEVETFAGEITLVSTHLEVRTTPQGRRTQLRPLLDVLAQRPVSLIGGDLNTVTIDTGEMEQVYALPTYLEEDPHRLRRPERYEPLFEDVREAGFLVDELNVADETTNVPLGIPDPRIWTKLDWIFARGVRVEAHHQPPAVVRAEHEGLRVSDHDFVVAHIGVG